MSDHVAEESGMKDMVFGSFAGMVAKLFEHPFDLVKVRLQSQPTDRALTFNGPLDCFKKTYINEGWRGLYRGISAPLVGAACENACLFLVYGKCQNLILALTPPSEPDGLSDKARGKRRELSTGELAVAAAGAGAVTSFVLTPIELIKCRMQVQMLAREGAFGAPPPTASPSPAPASASSSIPTPRSAPGSIRHLSTRAAGALPPPEGPLKLVLSTIRQHGLRGLWLGQIGTLFRETGGSAAWFTAYNISSAFFLQRQQRAETTLAASEGRQERRLAKGDLPVVQLMLSGALAGMSYNVVLFPADSVKSAMQTRAELNPHLPREGFWPTARRIWRTRGVKGMYAGCGLTVARAAPSSALIFLIYESLSSRFGWVFDR